MAQNSMDSDRLSSAGISTHSSGTAGTVGGSVVGVRVGDQGLKRDEDEYNLGPLPPMWEKAFTPSGEAYFIDHNTGTSHWLDPRLARVRKHSLGECGEDELPYGWERVTDERYGSYYVDHINRRTQYENPVLQARRLRAEKMAAENGGNSQPNGATPTGELRGERFTLTLTKGTQGLGFTLIGAEGIPETEGYLQIRSIVPHSPAWVDGALRPGDVLVGVGPRGVRGLSHAQVAQIFQSITPGTEVVLHLVRGYPLTFDSEDPNTRVLSTLAVDAAPPAVPDNAAMQQLTRALRTRFNLDSPSHVDTQSRDEPDTSPVTPHSPTQRRLLSRSFDLDEIVPSAHNPAPRCSSADHLLSLHTDHPHRNNNGATSEPGRELVLTLRRGAAGFGFTIADSVHGQKVKKVLDRSRCAGLREGDLLLQIGETDVRHAPHQHVVQALKDCPAMHETTLRVWRRNNTVTRAPRSRSATRVQPTTSNNAQLGNRSKTPTAEQLRSPALHTQDSLRDRLNGMNSEATYAVPEHKSRERESLIDRRRRSSTPGGRLTLPVVTPWAEPQNENQWQERETWIDNSNNVRNWAETQKWDDNTQKWDNNNQKWDNNSQKWEQNGQKWDQNGQKWDQNGQKWDQNGQKWDQNGQKWDQNGQKWDQNGQKWDESVNNGNGWDGRSGRWDSENWGEVPTPTVHVDMGAAYWRGNASVADSSDNGGSSGFPEDGMLHSPTTAAIGGLARQSPSTSRLRPHSPSNSGRLRSHSPSTNSATDRLLSNSPSTRLQSQSPSNNSSNGRIKGSPLRLHESSPSRHMHSPVSRRSPSCYETDSLAQPSSVYVANYPQVEAGGTTDPEADVLVRLARGSAGFGFRIVGGTEDGSRVAVGYVVPGGPADGLLRPGDLLTSVDGIPLAGATHARAVAYVCQAASRGHVTLGVRHNRADIQALGLPPMGAPHSHQHQPLLTGGAYNLVHPAPLYPAAPPAPAHHMYGVQYDNSAGWAPVPYDVTVTRNEGEGFGFVVISSTNKATSTIGQLIPNSPAARCGLLHVGDTILAINRMPIRNLPHPEVVALIKHSGTTVTLTVLPPDGRVD
ncbi:membrane-associated guanylate kinase, WW and PDZ domain-containing protein 2 isoform X2 [Pectinophora gossypiella]|uniref:membrane-associated guanylate kinase, WW and PDZ domain-containing protein 2 isoform X2 n=1 Tax=Pectinophora gossypiella TaxID=13191 RepID=UPI00214E3F0A|nr:membrane-associated guanylate kinase, WW and PDZ domain-containing protein 2 isoform X2 [Pectinophora gossypiella]